jgi:hypothetical protein
VRQVELHETPHRFRRIEVIGHRQNAFAVDESLRRQQRHPIFAIETLVVDERELEPEARLCQESLANLIASVPDDDDRFADPFALQRAQDPHQKRHSGDALQRLWKHLLGNEA